MRRPLSYPLPDRKIYASQRAMSAGEATFDRPAELSKRTRELVLPGKKAK